MEHAFENFYHDWCLENPLADYEYQEFRNLFFDEQMERELDLANQQENT